MKERTAGIVGSTGLIGGKLLKLLLNDNHFSEIRLIIRRPFQFDNPAIQTSV